MIRGLGVFDVFGVIGLADFFRPRLRPPEHRGNGVNDENDGNRGQQRLIGAAAGVCMVHRSPGTFLSG